jgi:hypothetical protein
MGDVEIAGSPVALEGENRWDQFVRAKKCTLLCHNPQIWDHEEAPSLVLIGTCSRL